ncbi:MAG: hypothetical protein LBG60_03395 [Bifidobacteriaceae bacterium]|nr:hypothetical protein [Bifidobacteriaceae bacterium]
MRPHNRLDREDLPDIPEYVVADSLPSWMKAQLRGLGERNGEVVGRHLAMVLEYLEDVPELAYKHARAAADRAGRIAIVREYAGLTSYYTERYGEAVRELRTYQRMTGEQHHSEILADALRGIGKPGDAVELAAAVNAADLDPDEAFELAVVTAGARGDLGQFGAARAELGRLLRGELDPERRRRAEQALERIEALASGADPATQEFVDAE